MMHDPIYIKFQKIQMNLLWQKAKDQWLSRGGGEGEKEQEAGIINGHETTYG